MPSAAYPTGAPFVTHRRCSIALGPVLYPQFVALRRSIASVGAHEAVHLPLVNARAAETSLCTYCPKLCRPACPVSTVEGRETVTPWGKMRALDELRRGAGGLSTGEVHDARASRAGAAWACTGCGRCATLCLLDNPVADTLLDGRADALQNGLAPAVVATFARRFESRCTRLAERARNLPTGLGRTAFVPGCTAVTFETEALPDIARAVSTLTGGSAMVADACCGAPLLDAGDRVGFETHARRFAQRLMAYAGVVISDAGCAYTLRVQYPRFGIRVPPVEHIAETAQRCLGSLRRGDSTQKVIYHDACKLGRGLGVYDAPRDVLRALNGEAPMEMPVHHAAGGCSGGGGLLPISMPATATGIARELAAEVREVDPTAVVVTACAASRRQLASQGLAVADLAEWIARAVPHNG